MARTSRETWAKRVERWKASGLSAAAFGAELGIDGKALSWWKWHLGKRKSKHQARSGRSAISPLTFVEMSAPTRREPLEVVLASGVRIVVSADFDSAALGRLVDVLDKRR